MKYLSPQDVLLIHAKIIDDTSGLHGIRDIGLLISVTQQAKSRFYKGVFEKAAVYLDFMARNHVFSDGNKRTSIAVCARFLFINGYQLTAGNREIENFILDIVINKPDLKIIAKWIKNHTS